MTPLHRRLLPLAPLAPLALLALCAAQSQPAPPQITARAERPSAVYTAGETVLFRVSNAAGTDAEYTVNHDNARRVASGKVPAGATAFEIKLPADRPGNLFLTVRIPGDKDKGVPEIKALAAAVVDPYKIQPAAPPPEDFDAFWAAKIAELNSVPADPKVEPVALPATRPTDPGNAVEYYKVTLSNIRNTHVYGQLAKPNGAPGTRYPAMLIVQWAGVYPLQPGWVIDRAKEGWLALNILPHDVPFDLSADEFKKLNETTLKDYIAIGNTDRETSYFLRMYLSCYRAADYLASRDDWDGKILVVTGGSQGGQQSIVTAGLHPKITAAVAGVPAGCDTMGERDVRAVGFPYWRDKATPETRERVLSTSRYFDTVNFARHVKVPTLVGLGLIDVTCPAPGTLSMFNQLQGPKEAVIMPESEHGARNGSQDAYRKRSGEWLTALRTGAPLPPAPK